MRDIPLHLRFRDKSIKNAGLRYDAKEKSNEGMLRKHCEVLGVNGKAEWLTESLCVFLAEVNFAVVQFDSEE